MDQSIERLKRRRKEKEEEFMGTPNWSELDIDLLRCVFERSSFTSQNQVKLVCSSWYSASKGCIPNQNMIPWLIFFPPKEDNGSSCVIFVPEDKEKVYRSRDFGVEFAKSRCMTTCGSWLLLLNAVHDFYILNPLNGEKVDLPSTRSFESRSDLNHDKACLWIDNKTKDYLVVLLWSRKFTKKGYNNWKNIDLVRHRNTGRWKNIFYNDNNQKVYVHVEKSIDFVDIWDFSGDKPRKDSTVLLPWFYFNHNAFRSFLNEKDDEELHWEKFRSFRSRMIVTVSGEFLMVSYIITNCKTWDFRINKINQVDNNWVQIDSLGDEALIYDLGITVNAHGNIPGIKSNSIYFSHRESMHFSRRDSHNIVVYDLTTQQKEPLPQCVLSYIPIYEARWFFLC